MSRIRLWQQICFYLVLATSHSFVIASIQDSKSGQLTSCDQQSADLRRLIFVSTLDGKISALDNNYGQKQWTLDLNGVPMLSSSIHRMGLNNEGQWIRLIPSLSGSLYKYDGENLATIPVSTDQLLYSSFRYSDDLVFTGGKETYSYGVSASTGKVLYECNVSGCTNSTERYMEQDILVIKRFQQTVRAIEPCTGVERWNFSVGQHNLMFVSPTNIYCSNKITPLDIEIKVVIPEGLIWAINKSDPSVKLWQYKFDSPIVSIWREDTSETSMNPRSLEEIDLFDSSQWNWGSEYSMINPSLYIGMYEKQLYVQENLKSKNLLDLSSKNIQPAIYPWQLYPAIGTAVISTSSEQNNNDESSIEDAKSTTALSMSYNIEYINGNGFYLYSKDQLHLNGNKQCNRTNPDMILVVNEKLKLTYTGEEEQNTPVQVITSLWYWWKEVVIISITSAILLNFMLGQRFLNAMPATKDAIAPPLIIERHVETKKSDTIIDDGDNPTNFKSRYLTDFEPIDCLGKGGYGVVFEAKNKIDDCNYAIKRIALPNSRNSRERVMREVKALAKLDHHNIVRYFNAWIECPPNGWHEEHDQQWIDKHKFSSSEFPSEVTHTETKSVGSVCIDVSQTEASSIDSACEALELNNTNIDDDSLVAFENLSEKQHDNNAVYINCITDSSDLSFSSDKTEKSLQKFGDTDSENIVFKETDTNISEEKEIHKKKQKSTFSLDSNNKSNNRKSTKIFLYIQMQLCQRLSLKEWLKQQSSIRNPLCVLNIFQQIVDAVEYVHLQGLIHRDLKPSNIFFAFDNKIKIGDFGLVTTMTEEYNEAHTFAFKSDNATLKNSKHTARVGTHLYMSPEQMYGQIYNYKVDIYSLGIILFELLTPFGTDMERMIILSNLRKSIFPTDFADNYPAEYNLLKMMLDEDPVKRPTTLGIKARPPLQNYEVTNGFDINEDPKWHFELPQLSRHSSVTSSSTES